MNVSFFVDSGDIWAALWPLKKQRFEHFLHTCVFFFWKYSKNVQSIVILESERQGRRCRISRSQNHYFAPLLFLFDCQIWTGRIDRHPIFLHNCFFNWSETFLESVDFSSFYMRADIIFTFECERRMTAKHQWQQDARHILTIMLTITMQTRPAIQMKSSRHQTLIAYLKRGNTTKLIRYK